MNDLINVTIQITEEAGRSKGQYGMILKLKGLDIATGKTNTYTIYETTQTGISAAWKSYNDGALLGQTVQVGYEAKPGVAPDGSPYTSRIIRSINEDIGNGVQNHVNQQKPRTSDSVSSQSESKEDFWDKKAYKQCLWNYWLQGQERLDTDEYWKNWETEVWAVFNRIEKDAEERFSKPKGWDKLGKKLKTEAFSSSIVNNESGQRIVQPFPVSPDIQEMADEMEISGEQIPY